MVHVAGPPQQVVWLSFRDEFDFTGLGDATRKSNNSNMAVLCQIASERFQPHEELGSEVLASFANEDFLRRSELLVASAIAGEGGIVRRLLKQCRGGKGKRYVSSKNLQWCALDDCIHHLR